MAFLNRLIIVLENRCNFCVTTRIELESGIGSVTSLNLCREWTLVLMRWCLYFSFVLNSLLFIKEVVNFWMCICTYVLWSMVCLIRWICHNLLAIVFVACTYVNFCSIVACMDFEIMFLRRLSSKLGRVCFNNSIRN